MSIDKQFISAIAEARADIKNICRSLDDMREEQGKQSAIIREMLGKMVSTGERVSRLSEDLDSHKAENSKAHGLIWKAIVFFLIGGGTGAVTTAEVLRRIVETSVK